MKVVYDDKLYIVTWKHKRAITSTRQFGEIVIETKGGSTECFIYKGTKKENLRSWVSGAQAECSNKDTYSKAIGRKISLTKALTWCPNKEFRRSVWEAYRKECRG